MLDFPLWKKLLVFIVCVWGLVFLAPSLAPKDSSLPEWLKEKRLNLGLDLRGGSYLLLEADVDNYFKEQMENMVDSLRPKLRAAGITYQQLGATGNEVSFTTMGTVDEHALKKIVREISSDYSVTVQGERVTVTLSDAVRNDMRRQVINQAIEIVRRRVDETGTREPIIQQQGDTRILLQVPGLEDPDMLKTLLGKTAKMTFHLMDLQDPYPISRRIAPPDSRLLQDAEDKFYMVKKKALLTGDMLVNAQAAFEMNQPVVHFRFNSIGTKKFAEITRENTGKPFAIVLDNQVITAPRINEPILGGSGMISGHFTVESANQLALFLRAGALPVPLKVLEERSVGPSLGQDSIEAGKIASAAGVVLVIIMMVLCYGLFGIFSVLALFMNIVLLLAILALFQSTLTLPGIAGIVLTMGMAVDANVLIFERMREEVRLGKSVYAAVDHGFHQAFRTIFDSNVTTIMAAIILYFLGSGPVRGFSVTLTVGILSSMFTAIMLTRLFIVVWLRRVKPKALPI